MVFIVTTVKQNIFMMKITNQKQFEQLVALMEAKLHLAKGFNKTLSKIDIKKEWTSVATILNSLGPPVRDGEGWQKVWTDLKFKVKKKLVHNKTECRATGGGIVQLAKLSSLEESVANLMNFEKVIDPKGTALGVPLASASSSEVVNDDFEKELEQILNQTEDFEPLPSTSHDLHEAQEALAPKKRRYNSSSESEKKRSSLLEKQTQIQEDLYNNVSKTLRRIENHLEESNRYSRKRFKIEEEKLSLYKIEMKKKENQRAEKNKMKMMALEIKRRKLELQELQSKK